MVIVDVKMVSGFIPVKPSVTKVNPKSLMDRTVMINVAIYAYQFSFIDSVFKRFTPFNLLL